MRYTFFIIALSAILSATAHAQDIKPGAGEVGRGEIARVVYTL